MKIVATMALPAVDRPNADRWNAARSPQNLRMDLSFQEKKRIRIRYLVTEILSKKTVLFFLGHLVYLMLVNIMLHVTCFPFCLMIVFIILYVFFLIFDDGFYYVACFSLMFDDGFYFIKLHSSINV